MNESTQETNKSQIKKNYGDEMRAGKKQCIVSLEYSRVVKQYNRNIGAKENNQLNPELPSKT